MIARLLAVAALAAVLAVLIPADVRVMILAAELAAAAGLAVYAGRLVLSFRSSPFPRLLLSKEHANA